MCKATITQSTWWIHMSNRGESFGNTSLKRTCPRNFMGDT